jgi:hypothetical protein
MPARNPPKNGRPWTPERVRERIRVGLIARRLNDQALGTLEMSDGSRDAAKYLMSLVVPKAEAPREVNVTGSITLTQLVEQASGS